LATDALEGLLADVPDSDEVVIYACGPEGMLRSAAGMAARRRAYCEVSLEERMGCGFGVCSGCVVTTTRGKERVCREGPVFDASEILWG
ncbi:MAG TPA: dihydroorotate dehydrogenase electron transfer subunit, partial [Deltaproteobacteria bacterium]|nr:dihydroorotate dehydrogenase electron transfer subunit [Deltaproteobacteria bacterium]